MRPFLERPGWPAGALSCFPLSQTLTPGLLTSWERTGNSSPQDYPQALIKQNATYLVLYEKTYHRRLTQKEFVISLIEQALEEAEEEFEAARAAAHESQQEQAESGPEAAECRDPDADGNAQNSEVPSTEDDAEGDLA